MKKILTGLTCVAILLAVLLAGCDARHENEEKKSFYEEKKGFYTVVYFEPLCMIVYDNDTKVMYHMSNGSYNKGSITPLFNADGTLRVWEEEIG